MIDTFWVIEILKLPVDLLDFWNRFRCRWLVLGSVFHRVYFLERYAPESQLHICQILIVLKIANLLRVCVLEKLILVSEIKRLVIETVLKRLKRLFKWFDVVQRFRLFNLYLFVFVYYAGLFVVYWNISDLIFIYLYRYQFVVALFTNISILSSLFNNSFFIRVDIWLHRWTFAIYIKLTLFQVRLWPWSLTEQIRNQIDCSSCKRLGFVPESCRFWQLKPVEVQFLNIRSLVLMSWEILYLG